LGKKKKKTDNVKKENSKPLKTPNKNEEDIKTRSLTILTNKKNGGSFHEGFFGFVQKK
jgi:hypothetical protein